MISPLLALSGGSHGGEFTSAFGRAAEVHGWRASTAFDANDPTRTSASISCCSSEAGFSPVSVNRRRALSRSPQGGEFVDAEFGKLDLKLRVLSGTGRIVSTMADEAGGAARASLRGYRIGRFLPMSYDVGRC
jgi:hypothetical protein